MAVVAFFGGPHDGLALSTGLGGTFLWTDGRRCFRAPARNRALYCVRKIERAGDGWRRCAFFAGNTHGLCVCGVFRWRGRPCQMCGSEVLAA